MICEKDKCTGCFACYNICPKGAIEMKEDEFGYIYPKIIESKCINCGLCKKTCPVLNKVDLKEPLKCLAIRTTNNEILSKSSSGGIATIVSKKIIESNPESVNDYKNGHDRAIKFLMGQVMKETKGKANPKLAMDILQEELR